MKKSLVVILLLFAGLTISSAEEQKKAYLVSNAHFDSQWNWDVQKSITDYIKKTLDQNLFLLEKYPNYVFNFESGVKYSWMKEYYPHQYELIKKYIDQGRWHVTGSTWDANDPNIPSPESFTRNILYGQHFFRDEFGVESTDIFLPDCFGFGWTLPSLAAHSGLIGFSTQKLQWRSRPFYGDKKIPFEIGLWEGIDGERIMMVADARNYTTRWRDEDLSHNKSLLSYIDNSPINAVYHYYGTGDTGGSPTITSVKAVEQGVAGDGPIEIISATSDQLFKDYLPFENHPELPVWKGELLMDVHATGCYTSQAAMKLYNRRNEILGGAAERSAVVADWLGGIEYPTKFLSENWKRFIWHQFHDDLTGTSIPRAYEFSWNDELISIKQFANVMSSSVGVASSALDTQVSGTPLVIYNANGFETSDLVEVTIERPKKDRSITVMDENGKIVPSQIVKRENDKITLLVSAKVPSLGYVVYNVVGQSKQAKNNSSLSITNNSIENSIYKLTLDANGDIASIFDKRSAKELVESGKSIRLALFTENESFNWPAWEILKKTMDEEPIAITNNVEISVVEEGALRSTLCVERTHGESVFKQYISLNEGGQNDRIDIANDILWQSTNALLKAEFPLSISNPNARYDLGLGSIERNNNTQTEYEVYAQYWADLTAKDGSYGVSVINDSKYGWDKPNDNTLRMTLLHTPKTKGNYSYQDRQDYGRHLFKYSIMGHKSDFLQSATVHKAEVMNSPLEAFVPSHKQKGDLGRSFSFAQADNDNIILKAMKKAEKSDEYVFRFYETTGKEAQTANITFPAKVLSAYEINGVEDELEVLNASENSVEINIKPFGITSFKVKLASPQKQLIKAVMSEVKLPYNTQISTYNAFRDQANFDGRGNSYPAELIPEQIVFNGIKFNMPSGDVPNGVKTTNDTVALPKGNFNKLYLLAASTEHDIPATFVVGTEKQEVVVPYYSGYVGQWGHIGYTEEFIKPADVAFVGTHKHSMLGNKDIPYEFTYMFCIELDIPSGAESVILPDDPRVVLFAATAANDKYNELKVASDIHKVYLPATKVDEVVSSTKNLLFNKPVIDRTGEVNFNERAECAVDDNNMTKWCDIGKDSPKYIVVDMLQEQEIRGWKVFHAGLESLNYITKEYSLQVRSSKSDEWVSVDSVFDNSSLETDRLLSAPVNARYVRLLITKPDQSEGRVSRIYEFSIY